MWDGEGTGCLTVVAGSKLREKQREERGIGGGKEMQRRQSDKRQVDSRQIASVLSPVGVHMLFFFLVSPSNCFQPSARPLLSAQIRAARDTALQLLVPFLRLPFQDFDLPRFLSRVMRSWRAAVPEIGCAAQTVEDIWRSRSTPTTRLRPLHRFCFFDPTVRSSNLSHGELTPENVAITHSNSCSCSGFMNPTRSSLHHSRQS